jgi:hypothetical protein
MVKLAKHWVKVPPEHLEALRQQLRKQVNPGTAGMTARNRALLRQFDPANVTRLVNLPRKSRDACRPKAGRPTTGRSGCNRPWQCADYSISTSRGFARCS